MELINKYFRVIIPPILLWEIKGDLFKEYPDGRNTNSVSILKWVDDNYLSKFSTWNRIELIAEALNFKSKLPQISASWIKKGCKDLNIYAPYADYCFKIILYFTLSEKYGFIKDDQKTKASIDILYFLYTPFCKIFVSCDKFHRKMIRDFQILNKNQRFFWGDDVRNDAKLIIDFISKLPDGEDGKWKYSRKPPNIEGSIISSCYPV